MSLVAAAQQLDNRGLVKLIHQRQWLSPRVVSKLAQLCPDDKALGLHLTNLGILRNSQLKQLFFLQVLQPVNALFQLHKGQFRFDQNVPLPMREMTGLSISAGAKKLLVLRKDTQALGFEVQQPTFTPDNCVEHSPCTKLQSKTVDRTDLEAREEKVLCTTATSHY